MLFNSWEFAVFFTIVLAVYWWLPHGRQNWLLLIASYVFYGWWDPRFLSLLIFSTVVDYACALAIERAPSPSKRRAWMWLSVASNLGILGFFKYWNFFIDSAGAALASAGLPAHLPALRVILPVGISFYTFQTMSYVIDVYRGELRAERKLRDFALYVTLFPQLVAGPIERATRLLPQVTGPRRRSLERFRIGAWLILWGLFEKVFVADNLAPIADRAFGPAGAYHGFDVLVGVYAFALQILCDFDGYSSIARGTGLCLGFEFMENFRLPYLAGNPVEFWRRWHISLSTWLRDYLYIPLGGSRGGRWLTVRNLMITMALGGLWHGAAWTFVAWGLYHGLLLSAYHLAQPVLARLPVPARGPVRWLWRGGTVLVWFHLVCLGWLVFRASSLSQAWLMLKALALTFGPPSLSLVWMMGWKPYAAIALLLLMQARQLRAGLALAVREWPFVIRWGWYTLLFHLLAAFGPAGRKAFIYFQF